VSDVARVDYLNGLLRLGVSDGSEDAVAALDRPEVAALADVEVELDVAWGATVTTTFTRFGVTCRDGEEGRYDFGIYSDGGWQVGRQEGTEDAGFTELGHGRSDAILIEPGSTNHVRVVCLGAALVFIVNDTELARLEDSVVHAGSIGLRGQALEDLEGGPLELGVDNFVLRTGADIRLTGVLDVPGVGEIVLQDDFSDIATGWLGSTGRSETEVRIWEFADGTIRGIGLRSGANAIVNTVGVFDSTGRELANLIDVSVGATIVATDSSGDPANRYAVVCRQEGDTYYWFGIGTDGSIDVGKSIANEYTTIEDGTNAAIATGDGASNRLRADCVGTTLSFFVNEQLVAQVTDESIGTSGAVGFGMRIAGVPSEMQIDDAVIREP